MTTKIALVGATGNVGTRILAELVARGHEVVAIARSPERISPRRGVMVLGADAGNPAALAGTLKGADAAVSALPFASSDARTLIAAVRQAGWGVT